MSVFTPKTRMEKILCGVSATAKTRIEKAVAEAMAGRVFPCTVTIGQNEQEKTTMTLNKTAAEVYAALAAGKKLLMTVTIGDSTITNAIVPSASKMEQDGTTAYQFWYVTEGGALGGALFVSEDLAGTDAVVLIEE